MAQQVDDDVLRLFAVIGTHDEVMPAIEERFGGQVDMLMPTSTPDTDPDPPPGWVQELQRMASPFGGFANRFEEPPVGG